jgi:AraC-like DNA-binding protein
MGRPPKPPSERAPRKPSPVAPVARGSMAGAMIEAGLARGEIATAFGYPSGEAAQRLLRRTPEYQDQQAAKREKWIIAAELHKAGATATEIARAIGVVRGSVTGWLARQGLRPNVALRHPNGAVVRRAQFDIPEAWRLFCGGMSIQRLMKHVGFSDKAIVKAFKRVYGEDEYRRQLRLARSFRPPTSTHDHFKPW